MDVNATTNRPVTDDPDDPDRWAPAGGATARRGDVVGILSRVGGLLADAALGLPLRTTPYTVQRAIPVAMPDRVTLLGDLYRPAGTIGPLPVVLVRLPYGREGVVARSLITPFARRGFQVFVQSTRGTFGSGGHFRPLTTEHDDGLATLAWLRTRPWCDGRVAMTGGSYFGHTQWAVAPYADPPLVAVSPHISASAFTAGCYQGGAPGLLTALTWSVEIGRQEAGGPPAQLPRPRLEARMRRAIRGLPLQAADTAVLGVSVAFWRDFVTHAEPDDDFWSPADHDRADLSRMPPVNMVTGWWDVFVAGQLSDYRRLRDAGVTARLTVGPWAHGEPALVREAVRSDLVWLDHHLRGGPAPTGAPVRLHLQQTGTWIESDTWPPPGSRPVRYHLRRGGGFTTQPATGDPAPTVFTYDPADPTPSAGGPLLRPPGKQVDNRPVEERSDLVVFTGPALDVDLDVVGHVRARLHVRPSLDHADVFVRLCDVGPDGVSRNVVDGIRRLDPRTVPAADVAVGDDGVLAVDVELFPTAYRVRAGHRLRVQVAGGAFPRYARNLGTGEPLGGATAGRTCRFEVFHDPSHPSFLDVPALDAEDWSSDGGTGRVGSAPGAGAPAPGR